MPPRRKSKYRSKQQPSSTIQDVDELLCLFKDILLDAKYGHVDNFTRIKSTNIRSILTSGVKRLISLYDQNIPQPNTVYGSDTAIIVPLTSALEHVVYDYLKDNGESESEFSTLLRR